MHPRLETLVESIRRWFASRPKAANDDGSQPAARSLAMRRLAAAKRPLIGLAVVGTLAWLLLSHPPLANVGRGEVGVRVNRVTGSVDEWREGSVLVVPGLQQMRVFPLRDQTYRAVQMSRADGPAPLQSLEGLSLGIDLQIRYALDPAKVAAMAKSLPDNIGVEIVEPAVQGVAYKVIAHYTVREIFSSKRAEIQQVVENELKPRLAADGIVLHGVQIGKVDLPADYRHGMEGLLAEELASEKMKYTLELKDKQVKETELVAQADKIRREVAAEAAGREQIIAAKAQEEAMKHVLPFKQRQIEQRQLEAEAEKVTRIKGAEGNAQARRIEATGEADARQKLADAEAYRMDRVGKINAEQMAREGELISRHPLLIQKTLADKLSDKIQVIIAPPSADGGFVGAALLGGQRREAVLNAGDAAAERHAAAGEASVEKETQ
ncbi:MAG TPA: SPFH domain-containing protein [Caldimonas sp.]|nr:SPFH domain-containing protein [Caldimonas sp.]